MPNRWDRGDILQLTRDCELGTRGQILRVVTTDGNYMTVHRNRATLYTGRDYAFARKVGTFEVDDVPLFSWAGDELNACEARLREVERRMREVPTARHCADRVAELCTRLEEIAEEFANTDHNGNG